MAKDKSANIRFEDEEWDAFLAVLPPDASPPRVIRELVRTYTKHAKFTTSYDPRVENAAKEVVDRESRSR